LLAVSDLELLGYHDSGMMGWPQNDAPNAFWNTPVDEAAARLGTLFEKYRPDVVATYDANGFYGHPDHIQAHRITVAAVEADRDPAQALLPVIPKSAMGAFAETLRSAGVDPPQEAEDALDIGTPDELIAAYIDCTAFAETKFHALEAHSSQTDNTFFLQLGLELFHQDLRRRGLRAGARHDRRSHARGRPVRRASLTGAEPTRAPSSSRATWRGRPASSTGRNAEDRARSTRRAPPAPR